METLRNGRKSDEAMRQVVSDFYFLIELAFVGSGNVELTDRPRGKTRLWRCAKV